MNIILGLFLIAIGILIIRFRYPIYHFTGEWGWAQKYLGGNGTVIAIILIWMLLIWIGAAYPFGAFNDVWSPVNTWAN